MPYLSWISDEDLIAVLKPLVSRIYRALLRDKIVSKKPLAQDESKFLDAFETTFRDIAPISWRNISTSHNNLKYELRTIHQDILSKVPNWVVRSEIQKDSYFSIRVTHLINEKSKKLLLWGYSSRAFWSPPQLKSLQQLLEDYQLYAVFLRENEAEKPDNINFGNSTWASLTLADAYTVVTGFQEALQQLYGVLPQVVADIRQILSESLSRPAFPQIFVSYTRKNDEDLQKLKAGIQSNQASISVWTDEHLVAGTDDWQFELEAQIEICDCVVLLLTPEVKKSKWVRKELSYAQEFGKTVIPFWVSGNETQVTMLSIGTTQRIDARDESLYSTKVQQLIRTIEQISRDRQNQ